MQSQQIVNDALEALTLVAERAMPRILSQVCRDSGSPFFGCADRNWWHYKMRDFPSVILQQSGATLYAAQTLSSLSQYKGSLHSIVEGSCLFWNKRATKFRAFEEYYPWEEGYPPLAFSTLSVVRMAAESVVPTMPNTGYGYFKTFGDIIDGAYKFEEFVEKPEDFCIATGVQYSVRDFVNFAWEYLGKAIRWEGEGVNEKGYDSETGNLIVAVDEAYFRPTEVETLLGDPSKAKEKLGWEPKITLKEMVGEMMESDMARFENQ